MFHDIGGAIAVRFAVEFDFEKSGKFQCDRECQHNQDVLDEGVAIRHYVTNGSEIDTNTLLNMQ